MHAGERQEPRPRSSSSTARPTDNNATLFKQGYDKVIKDAGYTVAADQAVPDWDNTKAGTIFEQIFTQTKGKFDGVAAANDGLGGAVDRRARRRTASPARSRSPARTPRTRACSACCSAPSA